jgi:hypothetical protein
VGAGLSEEEPGAEEPSERRTDSEPAPAEVDERFPLPCPECNRPTGSLKLYHVLRVVFLLFAFRLESKKHVACPGCMRRILIVESLIWLLPANVLWPFCVLIPNVVHFVMSFRKGHSENVREAFWRELIEVKGRMREGR